MVQGDLCLSSLGTMGVGGDTETFSLESIEVILLEQEAVPRTAWKDWIHEAEVSCSGHGVGFPSIVINQWPLMIAWCSDLWKQGPVLCAVGMTRWLPS